MFPVMVRSTAGAVVLALFAYLCSVAATASAQVLTGPFHTQDFGQVSVNGANPASQSLSFSFTGSAAAPSFSLAYAAEFHLGAVSCALAPAICTVPLTFQPLLPGLRQDSLAVQDQSGAVVETVFLHGIGLAPQLVVYPGVIGTYAGSGVWGYVDSASPRTASFRNPDGLAIDNLGNLYAADSVNQVIRKISAVTGVVTTYAGNGISGYSGDNGLASAAALNTPSGVAIDAAGNLYIADEGNNVVRKVNAASLLITTVAGGGTMASGLDGLGDGGPATSALLYGPHNIAVDSSGNLYVADSYHRLVRRVDALTHLISVVAGGGAAAGLDGLGDGALAITAQLNDPAAVALDAAGNLYIADTGNSLIRKVAAATGLISAVAGNRNYGYSGDGGPAVNAALASPTGLFVDAAGNLYIADFASNVIRQVAAASGTITTIAGSGASGAGGDGQNPTSAALNNPASVVLAASGSLFISDYSNNTIRQVSFSPGALSFPDEIVGAASSAQALALWNIGNQNLNLSSMALSPSFQQQIASGYDCGTASVVAAGASCSLAIVFAPALTGPLTGVAAVTNNSLNIGNTLTAAALTGKGIAGNPPLAVLSLGTLAFVPQAVGTTSAPLTATLTNPGGASLNISDIWLAGSDSNDFSIGTTCGTALAALASCSLTFQFSPSAAGLRTATVTVSDSIAGSPQILTLTGNGLGGSISLNATTLSFTQVISTTSSPQIVTVSNAGGLAVHILSIWLSGSAAADFALTSTCGSIVAVGVSCHASLTFTPGALGSRPALLTINDDSLSSPHTVTLAGLGVPPPVIPINPQPGSAGLRFIPVTPCRVADTRLVNGAFGGPILAAGSSRDFLIPNSLCGIPLTAQAYSLNFTVVPSGELGFLTVWPTGQSRPGVSLLNSDGRVKANAAIVPAGTGGAVSVFASNSTEVIVDVNGYFVSAGNSAALAFYPSAPCRVVDTRVAGLGYPSLSGGQARAFSIPAGACNIPSTAQAYALNFTAVPKGPLGYLSTWPTGQSQPLVSTLNSSTGAVTANAALVPAGLSGSISVYASNGSDVIIDINGYFAPPVTGALSLFNLSPCRLFDSRTQPGGLPVQGLLKLAVAGLCSVPATAQAYVLNATVVPSAALGFLSLWPNGAAQPGVSTLNAEDAAVTSNAAIVPTTNGSVDAYASDPTQLILDIAAYFAP